MRELSGKNPYRLDRFRYYELKYFCLQYFSWRKAYLELNKISARSHDVIQLQGVTPPSDSTSTCAEAMIYYLDRITMIEKAAMKASPEFAGYIFEAVVNGKSYDHLIGIPCCRETYYNLYRRFFWELHTLRN